MVILRLAAGASVLGAADALWWGSGSSAAVEDAVPIVGQKTHPSKTPPMGYNTWNAYRCNLDLLNEANVRRTARLMNTTGLVAAGYDTFVVDDCWAVKTHRDPITKRLIADPDRFPSGMKAFGDFVKSLGMKFGLYGDVGSLTCEQYPGSEGYEQVDADTFAEYGVDFLKVDGCNRGMNEMKQAYTDMSLALQKTGRPIEYSCSWPAYFRGTPDQFDWEYLSTICDTWRLYFDTEPEWRTAEMIMDYWGKYQHVLAPATKRGAWNDPDFLQIGHPHMSREEGRSQLAVWSIIAAPLIISIDIMKGTDPKTHMNPWLSSGVIEDLTNPEIINMNQEYPPRQGLRISNSGGVDVWARPMNDGSLSLVIVNRADRERHVGVEWANVAAWLDSVGVDAPPSPKGFFVRDLWKRKNLGVFKVGYSDKVLPHGCLALALHLPDSAAAATLVTSTSEDYGLPAVASSSKLLRASTSAKRRQRLAVTA